MLTIQSNSDHAFNSLSFAWGSDESRSHFAYSGWGEKNIMKNLKIAFGLKICITMTLPKVSK